MNILKLKELATDRIQKGNPLLVANDILNLNNNDLDGQIVKLISGKTKKFVAYALMGKQHKGIGWVISRQEAMEWNKTFLIELFRVAKNKRQYFFEATQTTAFRLFNAESDGLGGLTIDVYNQSLVVSYYSKGIFAHQSLIIEAIQTLLGTYSIFEKCRFDNAPFDTRQVFGIADAQQMILENNTKFIVDLNDGLMTGIFLDQRDVRYYLQQYAKDCTVLNTFSYTAAFSVAATLGGATSTVSVDVAKRSIEWSHKQFEANQIEVSKHQFIVMDVFEYFKYAKKKAMTFDWVILDPPSFARAKKRTFSVTKDYQTLLEQAIAVTKKNGRIIVSTNASNWAKNDVLKMIEKTFKNCQQAYVIEKEFEQPKDFTTLTSLPSTSYLKVFVVRVLE